MAKSKQINRRALLLVSLFGLFVLGGGVLIYLKQMPEDPQAHMARARSFLEQTPPDWKKARGEYGKAIEAVAGDTMRDAKNYLNIAKLSMDRLQNDTTLAPLEIQELYKTYYSSLHRAIQLDSSLVEAQELLAEHLFRIAYARQTDTKAWEEFVLRSDRLLQLKEDPTFYYRRGFAFGQLAQVDPGEYLNKSLGDLRKAVDLDPTNISFWRALLQLIEFQVKNPQMLEETYAQALEKNPDSAELQILYSGYLLRNDKEQEALAAIEKARTLAPDKALAYLAEARYYASKKQFDKALATLDEARKIDPTEVRVYFQLSQIHKIQKDRQAAVDALRNGLEALNQWTEEKDSSLRANIEKARGTLHYLLAEILLEEAFASTNAQEKQALLDKAQKSFALLLQYFPEDPRQYAIAGQIAYLKRDWNEARENLETAMNSPRGATVRTAVMLADVYTKLDMPTRAEVMYRRIAQTPGNERQVPLLLEISRLRLDSRDYRTARQLAERVQSIEPDNEKAADLIGAINLATGQAPLPQVGPITPLQTAVLLQMAQDQVIQDNPAKAIEILETLHSISPENLRILAELIKLLATNNQIDRAVALVRQAQQKDPQNEAYAQWLTMLEADTPEQRYQSQKEMILKQEDPMRRQLELWQLNIRYNRTDEAEANLEEARKINPDHPLLVEIDFQKSLQEKQWDKAREQIQRIAPDQPIERLRMEAQLAYAQQKWPEAIAALEKILDSRPHLQRVRMLLGEAYRNNDQRSEAREQFETLLEYDRKNVPALLALAQIAEAEKNMVEHDQYIRQAMRYPSGKANPEIRERWLQSTLEKKDPAAALAERQKMYQKNPGDLMNAMRLASLYEQNQQVDQAISIYEAILPKVGQKLVVAVPLARAYQRSGQSSKADELFSRLLKEAATPQAKAAIYVAWGDFLAASDAEAAVSMFNSAQQAHPEGTAGLRAMSNLRASQGQFLESRGQRTEARARWNQAIEALSQASTIQPEDTQLKINLASLYSQTEQYDKASAIYQSILQSKPNDALALVGLGRLALMENDLDAAMGYFQRAIDNQPTFGDGYIFRAEVHKAKGQLDRAIRDLEKACDLQPGNLRLRMDLARLYESVRFFDKAAQQYVQAIEMEPSFYPAHVGRIELFLQQQRWPAVETLTAEAMKEFPNDPRFPLVLAEMWKQRGQPQQQLAMLARARELAPDSVFVVRQYLLGLIEAGQLQKAMQDSQPYASQPDHRAGVLALQARIAAQANPDDPKVFQAFLRALQAANPEGNDVAFVIDTMNKSLGTEKIPARIADITKVRPDDWRVYWALGNVLMQSGTARNDQVLALLQKAQSLAPNEGVWENVTVQIANAYQNADQLDKAESAFKDILAKNPNNVIVLNNLAYLYADRLGQPDKALPLIERALMQRTDNANLLDTYAWTLIQLGELERARPFMQQVISQGQPGPDALYHMGYLLEKTDDPAGAREYYRQAYDMIRTRTGHPLRKDLEQALARIEKE